MLNKYIKRLDSSDVKDFLVIFDKNSIESYISDGVEYTKFISLYKKYIPETEYANDNILKLYLFSDLCVLQESEENIITKLHWVSNDESEISGFIILLKILRNEILITDNDIFDSIMRLIKNPSIMYELRVLASRVVLNYLMVLENFYSYKDFIEEVSNILMKTDEKILENIGDLVLEVNSNYVN